MSGPKEIRGKINSVRNIQKIAKAMEMISVAKIHKTQRRMLISKPYAETIRKVINHISSGTLEYKHSYFLERNIQSVGYWVVSTDRGLTGGLNINLFRTLLCDFSKWNNTGITIRLAIIGSKAASFLRSIKQTQIVSCVHGIGDAPKMSALIGSVKVMLQLYDSNQIDRLYLAYNTFVNTLTQVPQILQILPIIPSKNSILQTKYWDYLYEPDSKILLNSLLQRYIESQVYQGVVENLASEQSARMTAMKTASDNGEIIINDLKLFYNKARQTKITEELTEIVAGASVI
ncbi:F0F1 ATP synthase subunit gamma [Blochmannia endosymbiont of Camponotus sp. C-003]|uniref:F0F1 ATP synthase subunit gamma n=1 Tax=unclassified Candidatus Blochmanniella TaxID=711328 RepID=UPI002023D9B0|nr:MULTISPECIES: F0F1 ATP synthase subunit gamma [unclassified Candidatus Blochmannia]URJ23218.1 F0F1 ATP synthase subunit gamma [Blochmannia endosymbiont of Camponotus sp. C-003]URJ28687.1 F0F1 ATP synthase subunit gamma [Blochmannia endosymbiont of Camponotus sp. C-046]